MPYLKCWCMSSRQTPCKQPFESLAQWSIGESIMPLSHAELVEKNKQYTLTSWTAQYEWNPISMTRAEGIHFWNADGNRYLDWSSQLVNVNVGHQHSRVIKAIQEQIERLSFAYPGIATEPRALLGEALAEIMPH